jgi:hypothetical protein
MKGFDRKYKLKKSTPMKTKKTKSRDNPARKIILISVIGIALLIAGFTALSAYNTPDKRLHRKLESLAVNYYEKYYYDEILDTNDGSTEVFKKYTESGLPTVRLRQLINHSADQDKIFANLGCDTNTTSVRYYPASPYGRTDYTIKYTINCDEL